MWVLVVFVLPVMAMAVVAARSSRSSSAPRVPIVLLAAVPAIVSAIGVISLVVHSGPWRDRTELVWIGLDAPTAGAPVSLGGETTGATLGWPSGFSWPVVDISESGTRAVVRAHGGGGLV